MLDKQKRSIPQVYVFFRLAFKLNPKSEKKLQQGRYLDRLGILAQPICQQNL
jgi:hypothetical protein